MAPIPHYKVCIVGAGAAGLVTCKELLATGETSFRCFDDRDGIGGLWRFSEKTGGVMKTTSTTSSRQFLAFSDFRFDEEMPHFIHNTDYMDYLNKYVEHFKLAPYLQFNSAMEETKLVDGKWVVRVKGDTTPTATCDQLVVASGLHSVKDDAGWLKGRDDFKGKLIHSSNFKHFEELKGQKTLIIGIGESGADVVHGAAKHAKTTTVAIRRGVVVLPQMTATGYPADFDASRGKLFLPRMFLHDLNTIAPSAFMFFYSICYILLSPMFIVYWLLSGQLNKWTGQSSPLSPLTIPLGLLARGVTGITSISGLVGKFDSKSVAMKFKAPDPQMFSMPFAYKTIKSFLISPKRINDPNGGIDLKAEVKMMQKNGCTWPQVQQVFLKHSGSLINTQPFTKSPFFLEDIAAGKVEVQCGIAGLTPKGARFADGSEGEFDTIIMCTGFRTELPFLPTEELRKMNGTDLYKHMYHLEYPLAFVGFARPNNGAMPPIAEMQARVIAGHLAGKIALPDKQRLMKLRDTDKVMYRKIRPLHADRCTSLVDFFVYLNELAAMIGCQPGILAMVVNPFKWQLLYSLLFGPFTTHQYRLRGPHQDASAQKCMIQECHPPSGGHHFQAFTCYFLMRPLLFAFSFVPGFGRYAPFF